jgi:hypothetical protein
MRGTDAQTPAIREEGIEFLDVLVSARLPQLNPF